MELIRFSSAGLNFIAGRHGQHGRKTTVQRTPLYVAAAAGHAPIVKQLLAAGAAFGAVNTRGETALYAVAVAGHVSVVDQLLAAGADASAETGEPPSSGFGVGGRGPSKKRPALGVASDGATVLALLRGGAKADGEAGSAALVSMIRGRGVRPALRRVQGGLGRLRHGLGRLRHGLW